MPELTKEQLKTRQQCLACKGTGKSSRVSFVDHAKSIECDCRQCHGKAWVYKSAEELETLVLSMAEEAEQLRWANKINSDEWKQRVEYLEASLALVTTERDHALKQLAKDDAANMQGGWIDVKERLPANGQTVIVHGGIAYRLEDEWITQTGRASGSVIQWPVTHWQPLPILPPSPELPTTGENHHGNK